MTNDLPRADIDNYVEAMCACYPLGRAEVAPHVADDEGVVMRWTHAGAGAIDRPERYHQLPRGWSLLTLRVGVVTTRATRMRTLRKRIT